MYNKLFGKILDSSIWLEPDSTRIVWITLLAAMDEEGYAHFSAVENLARRAAVSLENTQKAILTLESPDPNSHDKDNDGRRIERVDGGWVILNAEKHRALATREAAKEWNRNRVREFRQRKRKEAKEKDKSVSVSVSVSRGNGPFVHVRTPRLAPSDLPEWMPVDSWNSYAEMRKRSKYPLTAEARTKLITQLTKWHADNVDIAACLDQSVMFGYRGVFRPNGRGRRSSYDAVKATEPPDSELITQEEVECLKREERARKRKSY